MSDARRRHLDELTDRWRSRHEARRLAEEPALADPERQARARDYFPWTTETPAEYAARHGAEMVGYTYDAYTYTDPALQAWLVELGEILRQRGRRR